MGSCFIFADIFSCVEEKFQRNKTKENQNLLIVHESLLGNGVFDTLSVRNRNELASKKLVEMRITFRQNGTKYNIDCMYWYGYGL